MIDHLVFFDVKEDVSDGDRQDLLASISGLRDGVPGVVDLSVGEDFSGRSGEYTHAIFVRFTNREDLEAYATHPVHLEVIEKMERLTHGRIVCDYEH